jgi:hypothetical protein
MLCAARYTVKILLLPGTTTNLEDGICDIEHRVHDMKSFCLYTVNIEKAL